MPRFDKHSQRCFHAKKSKSPTRILNQKSDEVPILFGSIMKFLKKMT
ncbi:hypothetical protein FM107_07670 [Sphingobacterium sp. JB170]|nr:hypothetical protein FM107_07670 [Sphingobacterium sp. JB170]